MRVLIVDDEPNIRSSVAELCGTENMDAETASNGLAAQKLLTQEHFDVLVLDIRMPGMDGIELLTWMKEEGPNVPTIMVSAYGDVQDAVGAMKLGAVDYLVKPFDPDELLLRIRRAGDEQVIRRQVQVSAHGTELWESSNPLMQGVYKLALRVAPTDSTVLVTGETGTGKEVIARYVHNQSKRADGPFVPINLGGIPDQLLESELFGYERGAFTGADGRKQGRFELSAGGTLFLDEIGEMPLHLQVKLLRVIQDRKLQRLGGTGTIPIDARIVAATNRDLEAQVADGAFREDLYYRLNVIQLQVPPLRERPEDITSLVAHFIRRYREKTGSAVSGISPETIARLQNYRFPGNVRELENLIERAMILADGTELQPRDFPIGEPAGRRPRVGTLNDMEREAIVEALHRHEGHRQNAADELGITRRTLLNKINEYELDTSLWERRTTR
ncbi:MAG: sigma-54 dependent transcriptional regulator [Spirochaetales bacterium]|nr:sigma-54 dependent transcriptional regulator [Spirochaetales bacterium]